MTEIDKDIILQLNLKLKCSINSGQSTKLFNNLCEIFNDNDLYLLSKNIIAKKKH